GSAANNSVSASDIQQCVGHRSFMTYQDCKTTLQAGADVGTGIGVAFLIVLWFVGFVILSIIWLMTRPSHRLCPVCGENVKQGATVCKSCGHDFARAFVTQT
ncbi:MAG: zinc ribbon domain-containing protein, partial [Actinomycetota bacterium]|nr:zinc ribbon domain-containing protein [Actinomycetota bacterium]